jgi:catechol 2,3-dioxygenase-like lactoylglutathione lyase family enzyme
MSSILPPLRLLKSNTEPLADDSCLVLSAGSVSAVTRARALGSTLAAARRARGALEKPPEIFGGDDEGRPAESGFWVPHLYAWEDPKRVSMSWERCSEDEVEELFSAPAEVIARWAAQPAELVRLGRLAPRARPGDSPPYLSTRWILRHEVRVASVLVGDRVALDHVSLHVNAEAEAVALRVLCEALGLIEIERPPQITVPGHWLVAGHGRVHLNSRDPLPDENGFPGSAPNHVCFVVADIEAVEAAIRSLGFETERAGSLQEQVWFRLPGGNVIELQPMARRNRKQGRRQLQGRSGDGAPDGSLDPPGNA